MFILYDIIGANRMLFMFKQLILFFTILFILMPMSIFSVGLVNNYGITILGGGGISYDLYPKMFYNAFKEHEKWLEWKEPVYITDINLELQFQRFFITDKFSFSGRGVMRQNNSYLIYQRYQVVNNEFIFEYAFVKTPTIALCGLGGESIRSIDFVETDFEKEESFLLTPFSHGFIGGISFRYSNPFLGIRSSFEFHKLFYDVEDFISVWEIKAPLTIMVGTKNYGGLSTIDIFALHSKKSEEIGEEISGTKFGFGIIGGAYVVVP